MFTVTIPDQQGLPTSRMSSVTYFVFAKAPNCQTEGEKKDNNIFQGTISPLQINIQAIKTTFFHE